MRKVARILACIFVLSFIAQVNVFAERREVINVPYIRQVQDMDQTKFLGYNACCPTSACMMAQFHNVQPKSPNSYAGWYVYNPYVGFTDKSGQDYSGDNEDELARDWDRTNEADTYNEHNPHKVCGAHGYIVINTEKFDIKNPYWAADPGKLVSYLQNHGLEIPDGRSTDYDIFNVIRRNIDAGLPLIGHSIIYGKYGHYLVIVGYDTGASGNENKVIVNDPYGDAYESGKWNGSKDSNGEGKTYALSDSKVKIDKVFEVSYNVVKFDNSSMIYLSSGGQLWPILSDQVYALLGFRCNCSMTPDRSHVAELPASEKSKYTIRTEFVPSENNSATGNMIAYRVVPKVGPTSCMSIAVDTTKIYLFEDGKFCHIANEEVYKDLGYKADFSDVVNITPELFAYYGEGEEVQTFSFGYSSVFLSDSSASQTPTPIPISPPSRIEISGTTVVKENAGAQYTCAAYYDNGSSADVTNSASWEETCGNGSIDSKGYLKASSVSSDETCEVKASYNGKNVAFLMNIQNVQILPGYTKTTFYVPEDYSTIQAAFDSSEVGTGYTVIVDDGTYCENIDFKGKAVELRSKNGPGKTIIDGGGKGVAVKVVNESGRRSEKPVIDGFTITNGRGGVYCLDASLTVKHCIITKNKIVGICFKKYTSALRDCVVRDCVITENDGGGIYCEESSLVIQGSEISNNTSDAGGGIAVYNKKLPIKIYNSIIKGNFAKSEGGGIYFRYRSFDSEEIVNCRIEENRSEDAGGVYIGSSSVKIANTYFVKNTATRDGGGIYIDCGSPKITNCTISGNSANDGGGMYGRYESNPEFANNILWNNGRNQFDIWGSVTVKYCDIQGGYSGEGNIDKDPLFIDPSKGDYHLQSTSPCVNAGTTVGDPTTDIDGDKRPQGSGYDIGADELTCANADADADGYYAIAGCGTEVDCDDTNASIHPNSAVKKTYYPDADGDGYGNINLPIQSCCPPAGYVIDNTDCQDTDSKINPGAKDVCDGVNNDCDWKVDEDYDAGASCSVGVGACSRVGKKVCSGDGKTTVCNATAGKPTTEICCDGIDNDCNGKVDEAKDKIAPKAVAKNITIQLGTNGKAAITPADIDNGSSDNCGIVKMAISLSSFKKIGSYKVTLTVADASGNKGKCTVTVKAEDKISPVAKCKDIAIQLSKDGKAAIKAASVNNGSSDNCGIVKLSISPSSFTSANIGANKVTLTVIDTGGNKSTCTCTVTIKAYKK